MNVITVCEVCRAEFEKKKHNHTACSSKCAKARRSAYLHNYYRRKRKIYRECIICGKVVTGDNKRWKYHDDCYASTHA
ncbi:MAG: hypothetical protein QMD05_08980 [Candidatus Brocadiaceae bacterium]|nr:hypothetical protein [Candidatus Brocadiaceae bacterium]